VRFLDQLVFQDSYGYGLTGFAITDKTFQTFGKREAESPSVKEGISPRACDHSPKEECMNRAV